MNSPGKRIKNLSAGRRSLIEKMLREEGLKSSGARRIPRRLVQDSAPLSFAQERLWFFNELEPNSPVYNIPVAIQLSGSLGVKALEMSINEIIERHEALRTSFAKQNGLPRQVISPFVNLPLPVIDLQELPLASRQDEAARICKDNAQLCFDLTRGPLVRVTLIRLDEYGHVLLFVLHHIVCDGWSISILLNELTALHESSLAASPPSLGALPIQYGDFAEWHRGWVEGGALENQLAYWKGRLAGSPPLLELPLDYARPAKQTFRGGRKPQTLPRRLTALLKDMSRREGVTLFMALLAGFKALLYRYTGAEDITIGTPIAGRELETEDLIGFFANTLALRTKFSARQSFLALLSQVRETALGAYANQDVPFEKLVGELQPERSLGYSPLFQVMFVLQNAPSPPPEISHLRLSRYEVYTDTAKFDLTVEFYDEGDRLWGSWEYNTDLLKVETINRLQNHFQALLEAAVANPKLELWRIPILSHDEIHQITVAWNDTKQDYGENRFAHELFEAQAGKTPEQPAVIFGDECLTYSQLNRRANQLARYLRRSRVRPDTPVGILMERSADLVIALLAVLKAGGAYVPVDPDYPEKRLAFMLEDSNPPVILTQSRFKGRLNTSDTNVLIVDSGWYEFAMADDSELKSHVSADNLAYVIYTSGSTGEPKGAMNTHGGLRNRLLWMQSQYGLNQSDAVLQKTPFSFDVSVWEFLWPLVTGARLVLAQPGGHKDSGYLIDLIAKQKITTIHFVPSMLEIFLREKELGRCVTLKRVICSGEALPASLRECFYSRLGAELYNLYGPTEAAIDVTYWPCEEEASSAVVPIGRPVSNTQIYILDKYFQVVPIGVPGELHIAGAQLARGYVKRPDLTSEKFVPDPHGDGGRLYKTGDLARYRADGVIEYLGRIDFQVKIRGFRIELGEIEGALNQHPSVSESVVILQEIDPGDKRLVAYVTGEKSSATSVAGLRDFLRQRLPQYMLPSDFVILDELPLTPNGKVDRRALPKPDGSSEGADDQSLLPRTPVEELLAGMFAEILRTGRGGLSESFFDLGGHSLLATQLSSRIHQTFGVEIPLRRLFESPTVKALAAEVDAVINSGHKSQVPRIIPAPRGVELPLSFAQQRLWFLNRLLPGNVFYNVSGGVRLTGELNAPALEKSINRLITRHEVLRTSFPSIEGRPVQLIAPSLTIKMPVVDLQSVSESAREGELQRLATGLAQKPFDLASVPLLRATLFRLSEGEHVLVMTMHHIISDGWSNSVLVKEIMQLYEALRVGEEPGLEELPIQYADFSVWQRQWLKGDILESQLAYWKEQLSGSNPALKIPTDRPRPAERTFCGAIQTMPFTPALTSALREMSRREGATLFMVLLAGFKSLLYRYTGQDDISIGTWIANRTQPEVEKLIGFFANTLVLRTRIRADSSFRDLLAQVRGVCLGAYTHQDLPFERLVDELRPENRPAHSPLFQIGFALQNAPMPKFESTPLTIRPFDIDTGHIMFDIVLNIIDAGAEMSAYLHYSTDLFDTATVALMLNHLKNILEEVVRDPNKRLIQLSVLGGQEEGFSRPRSTTLNAIESEQFDFLS